MQTLQKLQKVALKNSSIIHPSALNFQFSTPSQQHQGSNNTPATPQFQSREQYFQSLNIFKKHSKAELCNLLLCTHMLNYETIVKNAEKLYLKGLNVLGSKLVNGVVNQTVGRVYTGGNTLDNIYQVNDALKSKNVGLIINYCDEASSNEVKESDFDNTTELFVQSILRAQEVGSNIGIKYSGVCDPALMRRVNEFKLKQKGIFQQINKQNSPFITGKQLYKGLNVYGIECTEQETIQFCKEILNQVQAETLDSIKISRIQWESLVHPYYVENALNGNSIIQKMNTFTDLEIEKCENIVRRFNQMYDAALLNPQSRIYVDAEQSFFQEMIESFTVQYQLKYNKEEPIVYSTLQCYLKDSVDKINMEIEKQNEFGVKIGVKLVKGAYLNEESKLPAKDNLNESFDATSECYVKVAKKAIDNLGENNEVLLALHNDGNVQELKDYMIENNVDRERVQFAQLLGMSDAVTYSLPQEGFKTSKYVPFGATEIMIPYLCRRAYEGFKFISNVQMQEYLIKDELKRRIL